MNKSNFKLRVVLLAIFGVFAMSSTKVHAQFKRHYWLNPASVNYTLSYPTSNGEWMQAAARQDPNSPFKNTIAVFRLDNSYNLLDSRVIGHYWNGKDFDPEVNFEIHCIVESFNPTGYYIICGSMSRGNATQTIGVVVVLDALLNPQVIREYPDVRNFYSVYAQDGYFFVCGQTQGGYGIVLRDNITTVGAGLMAYATQPHQQWNYQKIRVVNVPGSGEIKVSGTGISEDGGQTLGYTIFNVTAGIFFIQSNWAGTASWQWQPMGHGIGSKVVIANHPGGAGGQGVVVSVSDNEAIYTYLFFQYPTPSYVFKIPCHGGVLEDVECAGGGAGAMDPQIAWVGNFQQPITQRRAYYLHMLLSQTHPPFPISPATFTYFYPLPMMDNAYYSLHKVHFFRNPWNPINPGDLQFHASGYYKYRNGNKTTFAVTPDLLHEGENECIRRERVEIEYLEMPDLHPLNLENADIHVEWYESFSKKYEFCPIECYDEFKDGEECGNHGGGIIIIGK